MEGKWGEKGVQGASGASSATTFLHPCSGGCSKAGYKFSGSSSQSRTAPDWLGPLEYRVLSRLLELGLRVFTPRELGLDVDRRRLWDVLQRLVKRGVLERVGRGVYRVKARLEKLVALPVRRLNRPPVKDRPLEGDGTREPRVAVAVGVGVAGVGGVGGVVVGGPFLDNVRGYTFSGSYRHGDRGRVRGLGELVFFERVSYAEVLYRVRGFSVPGQVVIYTNASQDGSESVRVEFRPPRGFVKRNGVGSLMRMYWWVVLAAAKALVELLLREAPWDVLRAFLAWLSRRLGPLLCVSAGLTG